jgi:hypothetical protein
MPVTAAVPPVSLNVELNNAAPELEDVSEIFPETFKLVTDEVNVLVYELANVVLDITPILPALTVPTPDNVVV